MKSPSWFKIKEKPCRKLKGIEEMDRFFMKDKNPEKINLFSNGKYIFLFSILSNRGIQKITVLINSIMELSYSFC